MLSASVWVCVACAVVNAARAHASTDVIQDAPVTHSVSGQFVGSWMTSRRGRRFQAYRGIRYAEPPVGELRFQPPKPILHYDKIVDASEDGPSCPRPASPGYPVDEDCLTINVYTPANNSSKRLPVIFYIHPGGFYSMSGRSNLAGPHYLMDRDVVLVTINYRLGSLGLFHRAISVSGSPTSKLPSPPDRVDLAIKQARVSHCPEDNSTALFHCLKTKSWKEIAGSMLGFFEFGYDPLSLWRPVVEPDFGQERFLVEEPMVSIREGRMHSVPFIISQTTGEFFWKAFYVLNNQTLLNTMNAEWNRIAPISFILPRNESSDRLATLRKAYLGDGRLENSTASADGLGKLYGDSITGFPVHRMANLMCRHSKHPVFYSEFAYLGNRSHYKDPVSKKPVRTAHHDDLIYLFTLSYRFPPIDVAETEDSKMVDKMTALWYNFARYGDPNPRGDTPELASLSWPAMTPAHRHYLRVDKEFAVKQNLFEHRFAVWDHLYPIQY
uniref:Carboxylesterase type B domain-containing protein n=2 Tax=Heliothis virescens TaxID=7102 RepID=A0A2A4K1B6_HELVI